MLSYKKTVRVTKRFLEEHPEELTKYQKYDLSKPTMVGIARFLGWDDENKKGPWHPDRISYSLERLKMITGLKRKTIQNYKSVAEKTSSRRREDFGFSHHREVEFKKAEWLDTYYPHGATKGTNNREICKIPKQNLTNMPVSKKESSRLIDLST